MNLLFISNNIPLKKRLSNFLHLYFQSIIYLDNINFILNFDEIKNMDIMIIDINDSYKYELIFIQKLRRYNRKIKVILLSHIKESKFLIKLFPLQISFYILKPIIFKYFRENLLHLITEIKEEREDHETINLVDNYMWDITLNKLFKNNIYIPLTKNEIKIFRHYCNKQNKIFSYYDILDTLEETYDCTDNKAKMIIKRLRKKLSCQIIENIYGLGYRFNIIQTSQKIF